MALDNLNLDYIENVLPYLFKSANQKNVLDFTAGHGSNSFDIELNIKSILECASEYKSNGNRFIHFTSLRSLHSILNDIGVRMYDLKSMNDPMEFNFIAKEFVYDDLQLNIVKKYTHVFSMCPIDILKSDDILTLWRLYGCEGNGCAIEFEIEDQFKTLSNIKMAKVNYVKPDYKGFFQANIAFEKRTGKTVDLKDLIKIPACLHKNPFYHSENEIRLFHVDGSQSPEDSYDENSAYGFDINSKNQIVSFHKVGLYNETSGYLNIKINKIQLGFKFPEQQLELFKIHMQHSSSKCNFC